MNNSQSATISLVDLETQYRPHYHFTPSQMWLNDPNGMVYYDGEYHLFYQYHPGSNVWGPMHWGHAVSRDLVNWEHLPVALAPDELGYIYSGSAVIDWKNTAEFGPEAMVAVYTYHEPTTEAQSQAIAYSTDRGRTWTKYAGNPVIPTPPNTRNFRDPKVFWHDAGQGRGHWVMLVGASDAVLFFTSPNLKDWKPSGSFGFGYGSFDGVWETPDLFELPLDGGPDSRWVLTVGVGDGGPAHGTGMQYFVGQFDGQQFTSENLKEAVLWADFGADFYAAQSWSDAPGNRRLWLAWMSNWRYANVTPTNIWRSSMTLPRELQLRQTAAGIRLVQTAVPELTQLRQKQHTWQQITVEPERPFVPNIQGQTVEIVAELAVPAEAHSLGIRVAVGSGTATTVSYAPQRHTLSVDRTRSGVVHFQPDFAQIHHAPLPLADAVLRLHLFVDRSSVEVFAGDGLVVFSELIFPNEDGVQIEVFAEGTAVTVHNLTIFELGAAQFQLPQPINAASAVPPLA
jgi:fructan beta-fructosidase